MNTISDQITETETFIKNNEHPIKLREALARLKGNADFRLLIGEEYMTQEAIRCLGMSADMSMDQRQRADHLAMAQATGHLRRFLVFIDQNGATATQSVKQANELLDELRQVEHTDAGQE